jgi:hypothetical protein
MVVVNVEISRATASADSTATVLRGEHRVVLSHCDAVRLAKPYVAIATPSTAALTRKADSAALGAVEM